MQKSTQTPKKTAVINAVIAIAGADGLDHVSVRQVAAAADVSIGTVQHYFPTKDRMIGAAYSEVVARLRGRIQTLPSARDTAASISRLLAELLPLDDRRQTETRVYLTFAAAAATNPELADIQQAALTELHSGLTDALTEATTTDRARCQLTAHVLIAVADGLAQHAVTTTDWLDKQQLTAAAELVLTALFGSQRANPCRWTP
jgi:AcrR family transcriptional regulator